MGLVLLVSCSFLFFSEFLFVGFGCLGIVGGCFCFEGFG